MKFSTVFVALTSLLSCTVLAADQAPLKDAAANSQEFQPTQEKPFNFRVEYLVKDKQDKPSTEIVKASNGETISLVYNFTSGEDEPVSIVGVGGQMISPVTGNVAANITASQIGPLSVSAGESVQFIQKVAINMDPDNYLMVPAIFVVFQKKFMRLGSRNQLLDVTDPVISAFNPKLVISELLLGGSIVGILYVLYLFFGEKYFKGILPTPKSKVAGQKKAAKTAAKTTAADMNEWLPDTYKRKNSKKAN